MLEPRCIAVIVMLALGSGPLYAERESGLTPVSLHLNWVHQFQFAGVYAAIDQGYYALAGLDVRIETGKVPVVDDVVSGKADFGYTGTELIVDYVHGSPVVALGATFQDNPFVWLARADSGIRSPADFVGRTVAAPRLDGLMAIMLQAGVDTQRVRFVSKEAFGVQELISGQVDVITAYVSNEPFLLSRQGIAHTVIAPADYGLRLYGGVLFTSRRLLDSVPGLVEAFRKATFDGWRYAAQHREEMIDLVFTHYNSDGKSRAHLEYEAEQLLALSLYPTVEFGHMTEDRWQEIAARYAELGLIDPPFDLDRFLYQPPQQRSTLVEVLLVVLGALALLALLGYFVRARHNALLRSMIREQTRSLNAELALRRSLEQAAKREGQRLQTLLDNTTDSVITIDDHGVIQSFNKAAARLFGRESSEVVGQKLLMLMPPESRASCDMGRRRFLASGESVVLGGTVEVEALHADGHRIPISLTVSAFRWEGSYLFTGVARDISKARAEQEALLRAKRAAEAASHAKSVFLSSMSHELRTPLNSILGFAQLMLLNSRGGSEQARQDNLEHILHSGEHLLALIDDLLELSKIESGLATADNRPVDLVAVVASCMPMLQGLADESSVSLRVGDLGGASLLADGKRLKQVVLNLVANAIKYNRPGGRVDVEREPMAGGKARIRVRDTGLGIPEALRGEVFKPFARLGQEHSDVDGSGVGLSISKRLVEAMGGELAFESVENEGSCFWIELPTETRE